MPDAELRTEADLVKALRHLDTRLEAPDEGKLLEQVARLIMRHETRRR